MKGLNVFRALVARSALLARRAKGLRTRVLIVLLAVSLASAGASLAQELLEPRTVESAGPAEDEGALLMDLAEVYQRHKQPEKALELYQQALDKVTHDYDKSRVHMAIGRIESRLNHKEAALQHMEKALELAPAEGPKSEVYPELLGLLMREGQWDKARALAKQYADEGGTDEDKTRADHYLIQAYEGQGKLADLTRELEEQLKEKPEDVALLTRLALTYDQMPRALEKAAQVYETLCRLQPDDVNAHFRLARIYEKMGDLDRAAATYRKLIETASKTEEFDPDYVRVRVAKIYASAGRKEQAMEWLNTIAETAQTDPGIVSLKADLYAELGMQDAALQCYDNALKTAERPYDKARFLFQSAELLRDNKDYDGAEKRLRAIIDDPKMPEAARKAAQQTLGTLREETPQPTTGEMEEVD